MTKEEFKEARDKLGWDVYEAGKKLGVTFGMIYKYQSGECAISKTVEILISKSLKEIAK
jgi:transcriptional regulator with XRE-family HTH domain